MFDQAVRHQQAGRVPEAEQLCRQILARQPAHADALHFSGMMAQQAGRNDVAIDLIGRAIKLSPRNPEAHNNLANAFAATGRLDDAIALYRQAIRLKPDFVTAYANLANALRSAGQLDEAIAVARQVVRMRPAAPEAHHDLGRSLKEKGHLSEAIAAYQQAILLKPDFAEAHLSLGLALKANRQDEQAIASYNRAIQIRPSFLDAINNLGVALRDIGQLDAAVKCFREAIRIKPDHPLAYNNLGNTLVDQRRLDEAIAVYRQAIKIAPGYAGWHSNLGNALTEKGLLDEAIDAQKQAIALNPKFAGGYNNLGGALQLCGRMDEAIAAYRQALAIDPAYVEAHGNLIFALFFHPGHDAPTIADEHRRWDRQHAQPLKKYHQPHANDRDPNRRLRIGYVSADFWLHPVGRFILPLLAAHDRAAVEIFCYSLVSAADGMTAKIRAQAQGWRNIVGLSDPQTAEMIRQDRIDILVDLAGHTCGNRMLTFALKPAPVQVTYLGYPGSTGQSLIDYRFTDALADPPGLTDAHNSEKLIRLPRTAWCFHPSEHCPPIAPSPAVATGRVTFGSFNNLAKVNEPTLQLWAKILRAVPGSKLLVKAKALNSAMARRNIQRTMQEAGVDPARLELCSWLAPASHLELYAKVDIALDTFPYHGTTTTCEALWQGVPVVTLAGQSHASRVGVSLLTSIGLPELIAGSPEQYVQIATALALDIQRLSELRATLRDRMAKSPLMDARGFAGEIESAYRQMWRAYCSKS